MQHISYLVEQNLSLEDDNIGKNLCSRWIRIIVFWLSEIKLDEMEIL